jgi:hypothetical protein
MPNKYQAGQIALCDGYFLDINNALQNPDEEHFELIRTLDGVVVETWIYDTNSELTRPSTGHFRARVDTTGLSGLYTYRHFSPDGDTYQGTQKGHFTVDSSTT